MRVRPEPSEPWPPLTNDGELDEFEAWIVEQRLKGVLGQEAAEVTMDAIRMRRTRLLD